MRQALLGRQGPPVRKACPDRREPWALLALPGRRVHKAPQARSVP